MQLRVEVVCLDGSGEVSDRTRVLFTLCVFFGLELLVVTVTLVVSGANIYPI